MLTALNLVYDAVLTKNGRPVTTSLKVAEFFGKNHKHVLRDISGFAESKSGLSKSFFDRNFVLCTYKIEGGKNSFRDAPMYELAFDGFMILVMGYEGERAMKIKEAYIAAFNESIERLTHGSIERGQHAERAYFKRYPERTTIRRLALAGEPYWYIGHKVGRSAGTVGKAIRHMIEWGMMEARQLQIARQGMASWWARRRQQVSQMTLGF